MKRAKTGTKAKAKRDAQQSPVETVSSSDGQLPPGYIVESPEGGLTIRPYPSDLLEEAEQESDHVDLAEYWRVIAKLREKGFTFREIAQWLGERNVHADHNAVYRVYTNHMTDEQVRIEADLEEREKRIMEGM